jgi:hypothetical protein
LDDLLSDLEQPIENRATKTQILIKRVFVNRFDILIMSFFVKVRIDATRNFLSALVPVSQMSLDWKTVTFFNAKDDRENLKGF